MFVPRWLKTVPPPGGHVFQPTGTTFELVQDIIRTYDLNKFHEDWTKKLTSRENSPPADRNHFKLIQDIIRTYVLTQFHEEVVTRKTAALHGTGNIFDLIQNIIGTHLLVMFHEDWTICVASKVLTRQMSMTDVTDHG
ncbi:hypothetical protein DPMN_013398 [Dreissena polymorpha]|uniref:Uncharacterized protein n=1 Tax=Dreissena polymorpha TaxID=45954 RepID=A0A9D4N8V9_DREPO|nr:hypothetical protein DPMN_013398 [Dreissena polymorpha]